MKKENVVKEKSYLFAIRIVRLHQYMIKEWSEYTLSRQILRSGTSIGALIREGEQAESLPDFIHKFSIALKEANETEYWLNILKDTDYINPEMYKSLHQDCNELTKLLTGILKSLKSK
ncbi:MAG: four helix bundle protein [Bacteroidetes bacterium]|nr:four helix bundle protein [Bacteroidota bacterium]